MNSVRILVLGLVAAVIGLAGACINARGHEAPSGFSYDPWCCSGKDCGPLSKAIMQKADALTLGRWEYCNDKNNCAPIEPGYTKFYASPDGEAHACVYKDDAVGHFRLRCLYQPPGN